MSTAAPTAKAEPKYTEPPKELVISYTPLGESEVISLTLDRVKRFLCVPTKSGVMPTNEQVMKFMMMCKAQSLNPWLNDAFLIGYDGRDGAQFSLITAHQSFLKRAEASPEFDGMESGVILIANGELVYRPGDLTVKGEELAGGWARVYRRDQKIPSYDALRLDVFNTKRSRWLDDPAGMITKCAEASALRKAFPSTLAAMHCKEEMDRVRELSEVNVETRSKTERLTNQLVPSIDTSAGDVRECVPTGERTIVHPELTESATSEQENVQRSERPQPTKDELLTMLETANNSEDIVDIVFQRSHLSEADATAVEAAGRARKDFLRQRKSGQ